MTPFAAVVTQEPAAKSTQSKWYVPAASTVDPPEPRLKMTRVLVGVGLLVGVSVFVGEAVAVGVSAGAWVGVSVGVEIEGEV